MDGDASSHRFHCTKRTRELRTLTEHATSVRRGARLETVCAGAEVRRRGETQTKKGPPAAGAGMRNSCRGIGREMDEEIRVRKTAAASLVRRAHPQWLSLVITAEPGLHAVRMLLFIQYRFSIMEIIIMLSPITDKRRVKSTPQDTDEI